MPADSLDYFALLLGSFLLYHAAWRSTRLQNLLLLVASYVCYSWLNWRWPVMLACFTIANYFFGSKIASNGKEPSVQRIWLRLAIVADLGVLGFYKYFNFFSENIAAAASAIHLHLNPLVLSVALPIGISFHVFQAIAYQVDLYKGETKAASNFVSFATFIVFFPQLAAGPIERAEHLLRQFEKPRILTPFLVQQGVWLIIWGVFQKVVVADSMGPLVTALFDKQGTNAASLLVGAVAFAIQIYCDFGAYSMIAKGSAALFGIELVWNFRYPYFSSSIQEFWRRWHISLSYWLRDYLYITLLGGSRRGRARTYVNLLLTMSLAGLWHGAAWHYVAWGLWHGVVLSIERLARNCGVGRGLPRFLAWLLTMLAVLLGWILFRIDSLSLLLMVDSFRLAPDHFWMLITCFVMFAPVAVVEIIEQKWDNRFAMLDAQPWVRTMVMGTIVVLVVALYGQFRAKFIYFQF